MSDVEKYGGGSFNATFYSEETALAAWATVDFVGVQGQTFVSQHIQLEVTGADPVQYSFDPRSPTASPTAIHGELAGGESVLLRDKHADSIRIARVTNDSDIKITAWR